MKPLIRPNIDSLVFVPPERIHKYDVVLYRRNGRAIMHRVIGVRGDTCLIRGDNSNYTEEVPTGDIFGVMQGFYRGQRYVAASAVCYRLFSRGWVLLGTQLYTAHALQIIHGCMPFVFPEWFT